MVPPSPPGNEYERLLRLRQQDGRPLTVPPGLEAVVSTSGVIEPWKVQEARSIWAGSRRSLAANPADFAVAERFVFLTKVLANEMTEGGDPTALRALYEAALEVVSLPRHRQTMRGYLARHAAKLGDVESAQAWLAGCDPLSHDLEMDSTYRLSQAFVATAVNDFFAVQRVLGTTDTEIPIADHMDALASVLRANAAERMGYVDLARAQLARFMTTRGGGASAAEAVVRSMPPAWRVCEQALQSARAEHRQQAGRRAGSGGLIGWILVVAGLLPVGILAPVVLFGDVPVGFVVPFLTFPLVFSVRGLKMVGEARRQRDVAVTGIQARARVVAINPTGTRVNHTPMMRIDVQVVAPGHPPTAASVTQLLEPHQAAGLLGREVGVIWSPHHPSDVVIAG